jgi:hypothetical protein
MSAIDEVYGNNYNVEICYQRMNFSAKVLAANIAQIAFNIRHDSEWMWRGNNMKEDAVKLMMDKVKNMNSDLIIYHIDKTTSMINMFPFLINGPVEYFRLVDLKRNRVYLFYITPSQIEAY